MAVEQAGGAGRVAAAPAAFGGDAEIGHGLRRGGDAAPVAVAVVVVNDAEIELAAFGQIQVGERRVIGRVVPVLRRRDVDEL